MTTQRAARLVGRDAELEVLRGELATALSGDGQLVFLVGDAGIGKTRTAMALAAEARERGASVCWGRCHEEEGAPVYWPWIQVLEALAARSGASAEVETALSGLRARGAALEAGAAPEHARFELFQRVAAALSAAARVGALLLVFDDLHWADVGSLRLLEFVGRELALLPVLALCTLRGGESSTRSEVGALLSALARLGRSVPLAGLDRAGVEALLRDRLGRDPEDAVVEQVLHSTDGNPFFVIETAHLIAAGGAEGERARPSIPPGARELLRRRLDPLPPQALALLRAAAVMGREFELGPLARALRNPIDALLARLELPLAHGLVREVPGALRRYAFAHALMRESLYQGIAPDARAALHGAIADALEAELAGADDDRLPALAHHYFEAAQAADPAKAVRYGCEAGERAARLLAFEEAARHFERALAAAALGADDATRARILLGLADALHGSGERKRADSVYDSALAVTRRLGGTAFADAVLRFSSARAEFGVLDVATNALLEEALAGLPAADTSVQRARLLARLAAGLNLQPGSELRRRELSDEAVRIARGLGDPVTLSYVLARRLIGLLGPDHLDERIATADEILGAGPKSRLAELEAQLVRVDDLAERADRVGLDHAFTVFEQKAIASRQPFFVWTASSCRTALALLEGRFAQAEQLAQETLALGQRAQALTAVLNFGQQFFMLRAWQNRLAEVAPLLEVGVKETAVVPAWRCALAYFYCLAERDAEARRELEALAARDFADLPRDTTWLTAVALLGRICARLKDVRRAELLYELMLPYAGRIAGARPLVVLIAPIDERLGVLATQLGRFDAAEAHFGHALALAERMRALPWQADVRHEWARMLRARNRPGDRARAQQLLDEAEAIARPIGMALLLSWIEECRAEWRVGAARAVGAEAPREIGAEPRRAPVVPLVPRAAAERAGTFRREGDVWLLAFEGRSTRVRHMLGMGHLARLLQEPEREVHAGRLVAAAYEGRREAAPGDDAAEGDAGELLDGKARSSYEARLREAREELEEAERRNDLGRGERLAEEIDFLTTELTRGFGLGGRERRAASRSERARLSVTRAIKYAIERIGEHDAALAEHLRRSVRTGTFCVYAPSARDRVSWSL